MSVTQMNDAFDMGWINGEQCFSPGNPYISTSPKHMAFEAGRYASRLWLRQQVRGCKMSRGYSIRLAVVGQDDAIIEIDYDRKQVSIAEGRRQAPIPMHFRINVKCGE